MPPEEKEKLFLENTEDGEKSIISYSELEQNFDWKLMFKTGIINGVLSYLITFSIAVLLNFISFGGFLILFNFIIGMIAVYFFASASLIIWFEPSPQWAHLRSRITQRRVKPNSTTNALQKGLTRTISGFVLLAVTL